MQDPKTKHSLIIIRPGDGQYDVWNDRGINLRFKGRPVQIIPVASFEELERALQAAVDQGLHVSVRGGGHCLENFVDDPEVDLVIDISQIKGIDFDAARNAIEVKAGTTLGEMQKKLFTQWGLLLPAGEHPDIGIGGHIPGGAFGFLCRQHGLGADYLYAVEILWVNGNRKVEKIIATREADDANRDLWWAHTGGGAGNFGIVTRYWFRSPETSGSDPATVLPRAPDFVETVELEWSWSDIDEKNFRRLVANFGDWCRQHAGSGTASRSFFATLHLFNKLTGKLQLKGLLTDPTAGDQVVAGFLEQLGQGLAAPTTVLRKKLSWPDFMLNPFPDIFAGGRSAFKAKDALLIQPFSDRQISSAYGWLAGEKAIPGGFIGLATYGGKVNVVAPDATASWQRNAILDIACCAGWGDKTDEEKSLDWVRACYGELFEDSGGVPVPGNRSGGCIIAHPDRDLADPAYNKSGIPWPVFYYQDNYPRLRAVKTKWDPCHIFHHALSVEPL